MRNIGACIRMQGLPPRHDRRRRPLLSAAELRLGVRGGRADLLLSQRQGGPQAGNTKKEPRGMPRAGRPGRAC